MRISKGHPEAHPKEPYWKRGAGGSAVLYDEIDTRPTPWFTDFDQVAVVKPSSRSTIDSRTPGPRGWWDKRSHKKEYHFRVRKPIPGSEWSDRFGPFASLEEATAAARTMYELEK